MKWIFRQNLGDLVIYKGKEYMILNGVVQNSWKLVGLENDNDGWVLRSECRKVWTIKNMWRSFLFGYHFYMSAWYRIWCREGIKDWMKKLRIW